MKRCLIVTAYGFFVIKIKTEIKFEIENAEFKKSILCSLSATFDKALAFLKLKRSVILAPSSGGLSIALCILQC